MNYTPEQFIASNQSTVHTLKGLSFKVFSSCEKLLALNIAISKAMIADTFSYTRNLMDVKSPLELLALHESLIQPLTEKAISFNGKLAEATSHLTD